MNFGRLITIYGLLFVTTWAKDPIKRYIILKGLSECHEYSGLPMQIKNVSAYPAQRNVYKVSGEFTFKERISYGAKVSIDVRKCPDITGNIENCKPFIPRITINNMCELLEMDGTVLTRFTSLMEPIGRCPLQGSYKMSSIPIDAELMNYMPIGNIQSYYVTIIGEYKTKKMFCVQFYIQVRPRRS